MSPKDWFQLLGAIAFMVGLAILMSLFGSGG